MRTDWESGPAARNEPTKFLIFRPDQQSRTPSLGANTWSEKRCVRLVSHATARRAASFLVPGLRTRFPAQSRERQPIYPSPRRWNGAACWPVCGWQGQTRASRPWSPAPGSRTNAAVGERGLAVLQGTPQKPAERANNAGLVLPGRSLAGYSLVLGDRRSLAPIMLVLAGRSRAACVVFGCARFHPVSPVCGRRNEWSGSVACETEAQWSGADGKLASPARARAEACRRVAGSEPANFPASGGPAAAR